MPEVALVMMALRGLALKAERGLQRGISFASKEERLPRGSRCGADAMRLPAAIMAHVLRRHGHAFCVLTTPDCEDTDNVLLDLQKVCQYRFDLHHCTFQVTSDPNLVP